MSSRRGEYGCRGSAISFPRRSSRERQTIYMSLDEDFLLGNTPGNSLLRSLVDQADSQDSISNSTYMLPHGPIRYSTRSKDRAFSSTYRLPTNEPTDDEDYENRAIHQKYRKKPREEKFSTIFENRLKPPTSVDEEEALSRDSISLTENQTSLPSNSAVPCTDVRKQDTEEANMYEAVKQRRQAMRQAALVAQEKNKNAMLCHSLRRRTIKKENTEETDEMRRGVGGVEVDDDSDENEPQQYALRTQKTTVARNRIASRTARSYTFRRELLNDIRTSKSRRHIARKRLMCEEASDTSSSSSEDVAIQVSGKTCFEDRNLRKMNGKRVKLRPINNDDLSYTVGLRQLIRHRTARIPSSNGILQIDDNVDFSKIGGLENHIQSLKEVVLFPLLYAEVFSQFNIQPPKGILFYGPPGTGKTLVARALANACSSSDKKVAFFMQKGADCLSKWVGESERHLRKLFEQAYTMRPSIIFFDEIDGLAPLRSSKQDQVHCSIVSTLLTLMDGLDNRGEVIVIGATNRLDEIDPALRRPGRFDRELGFHLPNKNARMQIIKIHTSSWDYNQPSEDLLEWLSERTSGYCGADLKSLCTEAVLIALRSRFPQVYSSEKKVCIDPRILKVGKNDFSIALRRIVPASRRDFSIPSRFLDDRLKILLEDVIMNLINTHIPGGYLGVSERNQGLNEIERVVAALYSDPIVPSARLLLCGSSSNMGQTSYILPVLINRLDHLPVFSLSMANLFSYGSPEERFSHSVQSAIRTSSGGTPCILLISSIDKWYLSVPTAVRNLLLSTVDSFTGFTSILLLATAECSYSKLPFEIQQVFRPHNAAIILPPPEDRLEAYFQHVIIEPAYVPPTTFNIEDYPELPKAEVIQPLKRLSDDEIYELKKLYCQYRLEVTLHYEETISRLSRDRRFSAFAQPVDPVEVPDYYTYIKNPMDLGTMFEKAATYQTPEEFFNDFRLIHRNALEYNPVTDCEGKAEAYVPHFIVNNITTLQSLKLLCSSGRQIRLMAKVLLDMGRRAVLELDSKFMKRLEELKRMLIENGVKLEDESDGDNYVRQSNVSSAANTEFSLATSELTVAHKRRVAKVNNSVRKRRSLKSSLKKCSENDLDTRICNNGQNESTSINDGAASNGEQHLTDSDKDYENVRCINNGKLISKCKEDTAKKQMDIEIDINKLTEVVKMAVEKSRGWPLVNLEHFAAAITEKIGTFRDKWDRTKLPAEIEEIIVVWDSSN